MKKLDIIATIGPSTNSLTILRKMKSAGMDIGRINTKYGNVKENRYICDCLKKLKCKVLFDIKNKKIIPWVKEQNCDYLAVSFTESAKQLKDVRKLIGKNVKIIAKIETKKGIDNLREIIKECNGIMVARGDLGKNIMLAQLPIFQKLIIKECNKRKKYTITATEMLLSMTDSKVPERAEVSDVANAVLDGSEALMLSEETAIGKYPVLCVKTMRSIIEETLKLRNKKL